MAFREKPASPQSGLINSGVYWIRAAMLDHIPDTPSSLEQEVFTRIVSLGLMVGRVYRGFFIDIGVPADLERARASLTQDLQKPAAFLDRDGTLNHDHGYTHRVEDFLWIDGAKAAIKKLNDAGYLVFVVTNQAGIARGYYDATAVEALHAWMQSDLQYSGAHIDDFRYCPHHPDGSVPELSTNCNCRKPASGMLKSLIKRWDPDVRRSFMLGDSEKDAQAGAAAGIVGKKIETGQLLKEVERLIASKES